MHSLFSCIWRICELPILDLSSQGGCIRKFPGNFLMHPGSSDPGSIREFPGNFLMRPRIKFKPFFFAAGKPGEAAWARPMGEPSLGFQEKPRLGVQVEP